MLGAEDFATDFPAGELTWTSLLTGAVALFAALRRRSAICLFLAAVFGMVALLSGWEWVFENETFTASRWLLLVAAAGLVLAALALRASAPRQAELLIDAAGVAILFIALQGVWLTLFAGVALQTGVEQPSLPNFWELIVFGAGCGLVAFGAIDRSPGPAWLGVATLVLFVLDAGLEEEGDLLLADRPDPARRGRDGGGAASAPAAAAGAGRVPRRRAAARLAHGRRRGRAARARRRRPPPGDSVSNR